MPPPEKEESLTLEILEAIEADSRISQRSLARQLGVALGLANSYLKRCVRKGLIKVQEAPANRYLYYLTPKGFAEKSRLTAEYLRYSLDFYRRAGDSCEALFKQCTAGGSERIIFYGTSELAEIAYAKISQYPLTLKGTINPATKMGAYLGLPLWRDVEEAEPFDACILTELNDPVTAAHEASKIVGESRLLVPNILDLDISVRQHEQG